MFVVLTTFTADRADIEPVRADHHAWLTKQVDDGVLVISGRQEPRVGGVVIFTDIARAELDQRLAEEPYAVSAVARHDVVRFVASRSGAGLNHLMEA